VIAQELPGRHELRAADALQLAAALVWCRERARKRRDRNDTFLSISLDDPVTQRDGIVK
jgi:hypothetical protein